MSPKIEPGSVWTHKIEGWEGRVVLLDGARDVVGVSNRHGCDGYTECATDVFLALFEPGSRVTEIRIEIKTKTGNGVACFVDSFKLRDLIHDQGSLGALLQDMLRTQKRNHP